MVLVHVKADGEGEKQQFLYECASSSTVDEIADSIVEISRLQSKIQSLSFLLRSQLLTEAFKEKCPNVALSLERALSEAEAYASKEQVLHNRFLSARALREHIKNIDKDVSFAQQQRQAAELDPRLFSGGCEFHDDIQLYWAGKELARGKRLCDYIGANEKTKIRLAINHVQDS
ncbi:uncharacterized protein [Typha angustifolia]|uniref:uncharacterized protein isoform X2 n=1 Tax=Typha angustifolia TaxID=59011 RepID=UPI003C2CFE49